MLFQAAEDVKLAQAAGGGGGGGGGGGKKSKAAAAPTAQRPMFVEVLHITCCVDYNSIGDCNNLPYVCVWCFL